MSEYKKMLSILLQSCFNEHAEAETIEALNFQSYFSLVLTTSMVLFDNICSALSILLQSCFNQENKGNFGKGTKTLSILLQSCFNYFCFKFEWFSTILSILLQSCFNSCNQLSISFSISLSILLQSCFNEAKGFA